MNDKLKNLGILICGRVRDLMDTVTDLHHQLKSGLHRDVVFQCLQSAVKETRAWALAVEEFLEKDP